MKVSSFEEISNTVISDYHFTAPTHWISSDEMEDDLKDVYKKLRLNSGRIETLTGVRRRGVFSNQVLPSDIAYTASLPIVEKIGRENIDMLIYAGVSKDYLEPSTASRVHHLLNLPSYCMSFDISNACLGFMNATHIASKMLMTNSAKNILICSGENSGPLITETMKKLQDIKQIKRSELKLMTASLTIGSGGFAWLVSSKDQFPEKPELKFVSHKTSSQFCDLCKAEGSRDGVKMLTNSDALLNDGLIEGLKHWGDLKQMTPMVTHHDQYYIHQVGKAYSKTLIDKFKLDPDLDVSTYPEYGNMGTISLPFTFTKDMEVNHKNNIILIGIGSGLNTMLCGIHRP